MADAALRAEAKRPLSAVATGRTDPLFDEDIAVARERVESAISDRRVLCVGAAGSIGSSTASLIAAFRPSALHVVDQNENGLTEFVRAFRAQPHAAAITDFRALPLDYGSRVMEYFLRSEEPYDIVLNFAAIKHVRSEKDAFSVLQMFDTNLLKQARFLSWLAENRFAGRYFSVSTDKAANPTSMMGATKRVMEHVMFARETAPEHASAITSARFANVAFSNGSLLQSFETRLARGEPLACPRDTKRYFVSLEEAGQICLLAAAVAPAGAIVIPRLDPERHLVLLEDIAERFLARHGYAPTFHTDEVEARGSVERDRGNRRWPLLLTPLDTSGEKAFEEFTAAGEDTFEFGLPNLLAVSYRPVAAGRVSELVGRIEQLLDRGRDVRHLSKDELKSMIGRIEPSFLETHRETGRSLDQRL